MLDVLNLYVGGGGGGAQVEPEGQEQTGLLGPAAHTAQAPICPAGRGVTVAMRPEV